MDDRGSLVARLEACVEFGQIQDRKRTMRLFCAQIDTESLPHTVAGLYQTVTCRPWSTAPSFLLGLVLAWLPVSDLLRLRLVNQFWRREATIKHPCSILDFRPLFFTAEILARCCPIKSFRLCARHLITRPLPTREITGIMEMLPNLVVLDCISESDDLLLHQLPDYCAGARPIAARCDLAFLTNLGRLGLLQRLGLPAGMLLTRKHYEAVVALPLLSDLFLWAPWIWWKNSGERADPQLWSPGGEVLTAIANNAGARIKQLGLCGWDFASLENWRILKRFSALVYLDLAGVSLHHVDPLPRAALGCDRDGGVRCWPNLRYLCLASLDVKKEAFSPVLGNLLYNAPCVTDLFLNDTDLHDGDLNLIGRCCRLERICMKWCQITGTGLRAFAALKHLHTLDLSHCPSLTTVTALHDMASLVHIDLRLCQRLAIEDIASFGDKTLPGPWFSFPNPPPPL